MREASRNATLNSEVVSKFVVANQLQFVNRQLHRETRALGLRYNDIWIVDTALHQESFYRSLNARQVYQLGNITIRTEHGWVKGSGSWIIIRKEECPRLSIRFYSPQVRLNNGKFLTHAWMIQHCSRGNTAFLQRLSSDPDTQHRMAVSMGPTNPCWKKISPFEKWFPWEETFDEAAFRAVCLTTDRLGLMLSKSPEFDMEALVAVARDWYKNGF